MTLLAALTLHVGGVPTPVEFLTPADLGETADAAYVIRWKDNEQDLTGKVDFYFQHANAAPGATPESPGLVGQAIPNGQDFPIFSPTNELAWDTSQVASGTYFLYGITEDPPFSPLLRFSRYPLTIRHGSEPLAPAVVVDEPDGVGDLVDRVFPIRFRTTGQGDLQVTLRYADAMALAPWPAIAADASAGCVLWDVSALPEGSYIVEAAVTDKQGISHAALSLGAVTVFHDGTPARDCASVSAQPDAGSAAAEPPTGCACRASRGRLTFGAATVMLLALFLLRPGIRSSSPCRPRAGSTSHETWSSFLIGTGLPASDLRRSRLGSTPSWMRRCRRPSPGRYGMRRRLCGRPTRGSACPAPGSSSSNG